MSFISAGIAAAGLAAQLGSSLMKSGQSTPTPQFDPGVDYRFGPNGATGKERARQEEFQRRTNEVTGRQLGRFDDFSGQMDTRAKSLADFFAANSSGLPTSGATAGSMPDPRSAVTANDLASKLASVAAFNTQQNEGLSDLRSFGDLWSDIGVGLTGDRSELANLGNLRAGSQRLLPFELQASYRAPSYGNTPPPQDNTFADLLAGVGKVGTAAGLSGWNPFGGATVGTPAGLAAYGSPGYPGSLTYGGPR